MVRDRGESSSGDRNQGEETHIPMSDRENVINRLMELIQQQSEQIQKLIHLRDTVGQLRARDESTTTKSRANRNGWGKIQKVNPPTFEDAVDPTDAEDWLRTLENLFQYSRVPEEEKVMCASFMLRCSAGHWWDTIKSIENVTTMTWERFKKLFMNKYFTAPIRAIRTGKLDH
ncbi:hypothetical protein DH2020_027153 [Rehmannia glutinosa]|uniref:Retrotransposon gag domain-containing protein n=1 Tax=Rehmannia glutinosa TaxID=99300 RepID=A0ABR0VV46_REHGL